MKNTYGQKNFIIKISINQQPVCVCLLINHIIVKRARKYPVLPTNILTELTEIFWEIWKTKLIRCIDRSWFFKRDTFLLYTLEYHIWPDINLTFRVGNPVQEMGRHFLENNT